MSEDRKLNVLRFVFSRNMTGIRFRLRYMDCILNLMHEVVFYILSCHVTHTIDITLCDKQRKDFTLN